MDQKLIDQIVDETVKVYNEQYKTTLDPNFIKAIIKNESNYNPEAVSEAGAIGLGQIMPKTAADYGYTPDDLKDPYKNIDATVQHYAKMQQLFPDPFLAIAAYNAGQGAVAKAGGIPPFAETINYVKKVGKTYNELLQQSPTPETDRGTPLTIGNGSEAPPTTKKGFVQGLLNDFISQGKLDIKDRNFAQALGQIAPVAQVPLNEQGDTLYLRLLKKTYGDNNITVDPDTNQLLILDEKGNTRKAPGQDSLSSIGRFAQNLVGNLAGEAIGGTLGSIGGPLGTMAGLSVGGGIGAGIAEFGNVDTAITKAKMLGLVTKEDQGLVKKAIDDSLGVGVISTMFGPASPVLKGTFSGLKSGGLKEVFPAIRREANDLTQAGVDAMRRFGTSSPGLQRIKAQGTAENISDMLRSQASSVEPGTAGAIAKDAVDKFKATVNAESDSFFTQANANVEQKIAQGKKVDFYNISNLWNQFEKDFLSKPRSSQKEAQAFLNDLKDNLNFTKFQVLDGQLSAKNPATSGFVKKGKEIIQSPVSTIDPMTGQPIPKINIITGQPLTETTQRQVLQNTGFDATQITAKDYNQTKNFIKDTLTQLDNPRYILDKQDKTSITQFLNAFERPFSQNADEALDLADDLGIDSGVLNSSKNPYILTPVKLPENASDFYKVRDGYNIRKAAYEQLPLDARKIVQKGTPTQIEDALFSSDPTLAKNLRTVIDKYAPDQAPTFTNAVKSNLINKSSSIQASRKVNPEAFNKNPSQFETTKAGQEAVQATGEKLQAAPVKQSVLKEKGNLETFVSGKGLTKATEENTAKALLGEDASSLSSTGALLGGKQDRSQMLPSGSSANDFANFFGRGAGSDPAKGAFVGTLLGIPGGPGGMAAGAAAGGAIGAGIRPASRMAADVLETARFAQPAASAELLKGQTNNFDASQLTEEELKRLLGNQTRFSAGQGAALLK